MHEKIIRKFVVSAGGILVIVSAAKIVSASSSGRILNVADPILGLPFKHLLLAIGGVELIIALVCLVWRRVSIQAMLIAWLATLFLVYRFGLIGIGYRKPCVCLGNLTDALHIPPETADTAMKIVLAYLLIGSYVSLFWLWRQRRKPSIPSAVSAESL